MTSLNSGSIFLGSRLSSAPARLLLVAILIGIAPGAWSAQPKLTGHERWHPDSSWNPTVDEPIRYAASRSWRDGAAGYHSMLRTYQRGRQPFIVYFRTDWCPHCQRFDDLLADRKIQRALRPFLKIRINPENGPEEMQIFQESYNGRGYPSVFVHAVGGGSPRRISTSGTAESFIKRLEQFVP